MPVLLNHRFLRRIRECLVSVHGSCTTDPFLSFSAIFLSRNMWKERVVYGFVLACVQVHVWVVDHEIALEFGFCFLGPLPLL